MKKFLFLLVSCILCSIGFAQVNVIDDELQEVLNLRSDEMIDITISFKSQADAAQLRAKAERGGKSLQREIVVSELKDFASIHQADVMAILQAEEASGKVADINALWIVNAINCKATREVIYNLSSHPDVAALSYDKVVQLITEEEMKEISSEASTRAGVWPHVASVNADDVWNQNYTGQGVVVAVLDTGTNIDHIDLKDHLWEGEVEGEIVNGWNFVSNNSDVRDDNDQGDIKGHGTHCAGIVCGDGTSGTTTGIAPDALLMTVKTINRAGGGSVAHMLSGVQFAVENGADILSISNGFKHTEISVAQKELIRDTFNEVLSAGVIASVAAGNDGNNYGAPYNVDYPAACPSPWRNPAQTLEGGLSSVVCVGAYDLSASSQGPSTWQDTDYNDYQYSKWINYCDYTNSFDDYGGTHSEAEPFKWAVKYTPSMLKCFTALSKVSVFGDLSADYTADIYFYEGGDNAPETLLGSELDVTVRKSQWNEIVLSEKVVTDGTKNIWIVFESNKAVHGRTFNANVNSRYIYKEGTWQGFTYVSGDNELNVMWLVRGHLEDGNGNTSTIGLIRPDISAPGYEIFSLNHQLNNKYAKLSGTSQATPCVAGVMALMLHKNPSLTPAQITEAIETTATSKPASGKNNIVGAGRIDALLAVNAVTEGQQYPYLAVSSFSPSILTSGNAKTINVKIANRGNVASTSGATYTISLNDDQFVTLVGNNTVTLGAIEPQGVKETSFNVNVSQNTPNGHILNVTLTMTDVHGSRKDNFIIKVEELPNIVYKSHTPSIINPKDGNVEVSVTMQNVGTAAMTNNTDVTLSAISSSLNHIDIVDAEATIGPLDVNATATATFTVKAKETASDGYILDLFLETFSESTSPSNFVYEFENDLEGWTSFDNTLNGIKTPWWHSSLGANQDIDNVAESHSGSGHAMSKTMYATIPTTPYQYPIDNYLVSPVKLLITENSKISFWARANHDNLYPEHFAVSVSQTSNTSGFVDVRNADWTITESTKSWNEYTVNLRAYAGKEIYVAIRHYFTEEEWNELDCGYEVQALCIDDIVLSDVIVDYHHVPSYDDTDENYFNIVVANPVDLGAPTGLTATNVTTESITLGWDELEHAQSYNVYCNGEKLANVKTTSYTHTGLTHNTEYCYTVTGMNNIYEHEHSEELCVTTVQKDYSVAIQSVTPTEVFYDGSNINLTITFVNDGKKEHQSRCYYQLESSDAYVKSISARQTNAVLAPGATTTKTFSITLDEEIPNDYEIAFNASVDYMFGPQQGGYDGIQQSWDIPLTLFVKNDVNTPKNLAVIAKNENSITLTWDANANAIRYNVYRDDEYVGHTTATTYIDGGLEPETEYNYYVTSITAEGIESSASIGVTETTKALSEGIVLESFTMGTAIGENIELRAVMVNNGAEATPEATTATLTCTDPYVTVVDATADLGSMAAGATATAVFTIKLDALIPANYNLNFAVTAEYEGEGGGGPSTLSYGFNNGDLDGWHAFDANGDASTWSYTADKSYEGAGCIKNLAYKNGGYLNQKDYVISPNKITPTAETEFIFRVAPNDDVYCYDSYNVMLSTSAELPSKESDFMQISNYYIDEGGWKQQVISLGGYEGQEIWIALHHYENGEGYGDALLIDDITITNIAASEDAIIISKTSTFSVTANQSLNIFAGTGLWSNASLWSKGFVPSSTDDVIIEGDATIAEGEINVNSVSIEEGTLTMDGGALTVAGLFVNTDAEAFIINDGAQVRQSSDNVAATFNMDVTNWNDASSWQFISSPVKNVMVTDFLPTTGYDFMKYDGTQTGAEWYNYQAHEAEFENALVLGRGYLVSYETESMASFQGVLNNETSFTFTDVKPYVENNDYANLYLLGNPFSFDMDLANLNAYGMEAGIAVINTTGNGYEYRTSGVVNVGDGFFVKAAEATASLSYSEGAKRGNDNVAPSINLIATSNTGNDNVIIRFAGEETEGFNKLDNFDKGIAEIYVENNNGRYAILSYDEKATEIEVNFHANQMGNYTIAAITEGDFRNVVLVDRLSGIETNLMIEDYNFTATSGDNAKRFLIKIDNGHQSSDNANFAYQSGEELVVEAEGTVQIIDIMGRIVYCDDVESTNNRINVSNFNNGTYVVRVINENEVKVQKIIL